MKHLAQVSMDSQDISFAPASYRTKPCNLCILNIKECKFVCLREGPSYYVTQVKFYGRFRSWLRHWKFKFFKHY